MHILFKKDGCCCGRAWVGPSSAPSCCLGVEVLEDNGIEMGVVNIGKEGPCSHTYNIHNKRCVCVKGIDIRRAGISSMWWAQGIEISKEFAARSCSKCYRLLWH